MGLLNTVIKRQDAQNNVSNAPAASDERKLLMNINSRVEDLKLQNLENAKFLRGISRKIEDELNQMHELEENRSIEIYDDSNILESIERVEKSLKDINNDEVLDAIEKINTSIKGMDNSIEVMDAIEKVNTSIKGMDNTAVVLNAIENVQASLSKINTEELLRIQENVRKLQQEVQKFDYERIMSELAKLDAAVCNVNTEVIFIELDKINKAIEKISAADIIVEEIAKTNQKLDELRSADVLKEIHRVEELVAEISDRTVLSELQRIKLLINEKNSTEIVNTFDEKIKRLSPKDYSDNFFELKQMLKAIEEKNDEIGKKLDRVATMPTMVKSILDKTNGENMSRMEELIADVNGRQRKGTDTIKTRISVNMWVSILTLAIVIAKLLQII